jgi:hypothetical protein
MKKRASTSKTSKTKTKKRSYANVASRKYWASVHKRIKDSKCTIQTTKRYTARSSPPYPANKCCGKTLKGNDGKKYVSEPGALGICAWKLTRS